jgi:transcriptional regulator with XRE-family HTH domain
MTDLGSRRGAIANKLKAARERVGLTQAQVARILGLHRPSISEIEAGRRSVSAEELATLAETYKVSLDWLVGQVPFDSDRSFFKGTNDLSTLAGEELTHFLERVMTQERPSSQA